MIQSAQREAGVERLRDHLIRVATDRGLAVDTEPQDLHIDRLPLESGPDTEHSDSGTSNPLHLLVIDRYTTLIGSLEQSADRTSRNLALDEYHWHAATVRSWLSQNRKDDLMLVLAGPDGSDSMPEWRLASVEIEGDDRVCRKLLWLRPREEEAVESSIDRLVARTFLAQPWTAESLASTESPDRWERLEKDLEMASETQEGDLAILRAWRHWLVEPSDGEGHPIGPGRDLVDKLLASLSTDPAL